MALAGCNPQETNSSAAATSKTSENASAPIRVGMSGGYYPFTFVSQDQLQGFEVDVWNEIGTRLGQPVEFITAPFSGLFGMLETGKVDTISNQITVTDARREQYGFTQPYVIDGAQLTINSDDNTIAGLEDLKGKKVAVNLGSNYETLIRQQAVNLFGDEQAIDIITYDTGIEQEVALGRIDAFVMDRLSAAELIKKSGLPLKLAGTPFETIENAMPFLKTPEADTLRSKVDKTIASMRADGTLADISIKWFGSDITTRS
nr:amino acid ABC transporter substrate-binding protein [Kistimonas asteriae]